MPTVPTTQPNELAQSAAPAPGAQVNSTAKLTRPLARRHALSADWRSTRSARSMCGSVLVIVFSIWVPATFPTSATREADPQCQRDHRDCGARDHDSAGRASVRSLVRVHDDADRRRHRALHLGRRSARACGVARPRHRGRDRDDQRDRRRRHADRFVHRHAGNRIPDPGADHDGDRRHADSQPPARWQLLQDRPDDDSRLHPAGPVRVRVGICDLVPARAHRERADDCTRPGSIPTRQNWRACA